MIILNIVQFRWLNFLEGNPRIQDVELRTNKGVSVTFQLITDSTRKEVPARWTGRCDPEWFPITKLPQWARKHLELP